MVVGRGPGDAFPGTSLAHAWQQRCSRPRSPLFPTPLLYPPCGLNYFSSQQWLDNTPCLPKGGNSYLPRLPLEGGSPPSWLARAPTSMWMGHLALELGLAGGKRRTLGAALPVTSYRAVLPNKKHGATSTVLAWEPQGALSKGIPHLLGRDAKGPIPLGSVEVQVATSKARCESSLGNEIRNDHPNPQDACHPFQKGLSRPFSSQQDDRLKAVHESRGEAGVGALRWRWGCFLLLQLPFSHSSSPAAEVSTHLLPVLPLSAR